MMYLRLFFLGIGCGRGCGFGRGLGRLGILDNRTRDSRCTSPNKQNMLGWNTPEFGRILGGYPGAGFGGPRAKGATIYRTVMQ